MVFAMFIEFFLSLANHLHVMVIIKKIKAFLKKMKGNNGNCQKLKPDPIFIKKKRYHRREMYFYKNEVL